MIENVNREYLGTIGNMSGMEVDILPYHECETELDEQWSYVGNKGNQRGCG